jgi:hypothetical protein
MTMRLLRRRNRAGCFPAADRSRFKYAMTRPNNSPLVPSIFSPSVCSMRSLLLLQELWECRGVLLSERSSTVTDPQRRNGHACTSVGYLLVDDDGRRDLLWGRRSSDTGSASKAF